MKTKLISSMMSILALLAGSSFALDCPKFPEQASKDWEVSVNAEVAKIGPLKGADLKTTTRSITKNLLSKLPDAGKIYLEQMMFAAYCTSLRDDKALTDTEKSKRLNEYIREVRKVTRTKNTIKPKDKSPLAKNVATPDTKSDHTSPSTEKNAPVISMGQTGGITAQTVIVNAEEKRKPREITPEQARAITEYLANKLIGAFVIKANIIVPDAPSYAKQIAELFKGAGWNVRVDSAIISGANGSVWITVKNQAAAPAYCVVLQKALESAGIPALAYYDSDMPATEEVWLSIGAK